MQRTKLTTPLRLDHLAVWVADMDKSVEFLTDIVGLKRHPMVVEVSDDDPTCGGMKAIFIDGNGLWLEMILPTSAGPGMDILNDVGPGAIVEVNFETVGEDYINIINDMDRAGIQMLAMDGSPLVDGGRIDEGVAGMSDTHETGQRIAYWPTDVSCGTTIEIYEKLLDDETNLLNIRNSDWGDEQRNANGPRMDRVGLLVEDIDKTASFYTDILGLNALPEIFDIPADANSIGGMRLAYIKASEEANVWVQLIQPTTAGYAMDLLKENGDGFPMEVSIEVSDLDAYVDRVRSQGISMVNFDGSPISDGAKSITLQPYGDKYCYFPLSASQGMRIMVYERGPWETSLVHRRDDSFAA